MDSQPSLVLNPVGSPVQSVRVDNDLFADVWEWELGNVLNTGNHAFFGLNMSQSPYAPSKLNQLMAAARPARIIEIGAGNGGLTVLFALYARINGASLYAYDKTAGKHADLLRLLGSAVILKDALEDPVTVEEIRSLVRAEGRTIIFCDAGKALEFNLYAPSMKEGDIILMHDFSPTHETFKADMEGQRWNWHEAWYERVAETCNKCNIVHSPYFNDVAWSCGIKVSS